MRWAVLPFLRAQRRRSQRVNESQLFEKALLLATAAERAAFLDEACAGNPGLRADVEALLKAHADDPDFMEQSAAPLGGTEDVPPTPPRSAQASAAEQPGAVLGGRYKLLEQIGE